MSLQQRRGLSAVLLVLFCASVSRPESPVSHRMDAHGDPLPLGALARLGTVRLRPGNSAKRVAFSVDGKVFATEEEPGTIRFWDLKTEKEIRSVQVPGRFVTALTISPDGRYFATIVDRSWNAFRVPNTRNAVFVGAVADGKILHEFRDKGMGFDSLKFAAQGRRLSAKHIVVPSGEEKEVQTAFVWDIATGKELRTFEDARAFAISDDGVTAAVGHSDGSISVHDLDADKIIASWKAHDGAVHGLALLPDSKGLASAGEKQEEKKKDGTKTDKWDSICLWNPATGAERLRFADYPGEVKHLRFSPDGRTMAALGLGRPSKKDEDSYHLGDGPITHLFATSTGLRLELKVEGLEHSWDVFFSPDSKSIIFRNDYRLLPQVEIASGKLIRRFGKGSEWAYDLAFSPDGKLLAAVRGAIWLWEVETGKEVFPTSSHRAKVVSLVFSPDGKTLASLDSVNRLLLWDMSSARVLHPGADFAENVVFTHVFSKAGRLLTVVESDGRVCVWDVSTGKKLHEFQALADKEHRWIRQGARDVVLSPEGDALAVADDQNAIRLYDVAAGKEQGKLKGHENSPVRFQFSPDGKTLTSRGDDNTIRVWDLVTAAEQACFRTSQKEGGVFAYSLDGRLLAWSWDGTVHLWDVAAKNVRGNFLGNAERLTGIAFGGDSKTLATVEKDGTIRTWDIASEKELHALKGKSNRNFGYPTLCKGPSNPIIAKGETDAKGYRHELRVASTGRTLCSLTGDEPYGFSTDGKLVAAWADWLIIRDSTTGRERAWLPPAHRGDLSALAFSPDGKLLATGGEDSEIILWDVKPLRTPGAPQLYTLPRRELARLWTDLALDGKPFDAVHYLLGDPEQAVPFLNEKLGRIPAEDPERVRKWVGQLDDDDFETREKASEELGKLGKVAEAFLRPVLAGEPSQEMRRRIEKLLESAKSPSSLPPDCQRAQKALEVLELLNSPASRQVLASLAQAKADLWVGREANAAFERCEKP